MCVLVRLVMFAAGEATTRGDRVSSCGFENAQSLLFAPSLVLLASITRPASSCCHSEEICFSWQQRREWQTPDFFVIMRARPHEEADQFHACASSFYATCIQIRALALCCEAKLSVVCFMPILMQKNLNEAVTVKILCVCVCVTLSRISSTSMPGQKGHSMRHPLKNTFPMRCFVFRSIVWRMCFVHTPYSAPDRVTYRWKAMSAWDKKISKWVLSTVLVLRLYFVKFHILIVAVRLLSVSNQ